MFETTTWQPLSWRRNPALNSYGISTRLGFWRRLAFVHFTAIAVQNSHRGTAVLEPWNSKTIYLSPFAGSCQNTGSRRIMNHESWRLDDYFLTVTWFRQAPKWFVSVLNMYIVPQKFSEVVSRLALNFGFHDFPAMHPSNYSWSKVYGSRILRHGNAATFATCCGRYFGVADFAEGFRHVLDLSVQSVFFGIQKKFEPLCWQVRKNYKT